LRFTRAGLADTTIRVDIDNNTNYYTIPNMGQVTNLNAIDPNNWVINNVGSIVNDPTMMAGLNDLNTTNSVYLIYPNPSNGNFTIETSELGDNSVTILDTRGRKISDLNFQKVGQLDISNEKSGNYILQITNEKGEKRIQTIVKN